LRALEGIYRYVLDRADTTVTAEFVLIHFHDDWDPAAGRAHAWTDQAGRFRVEDEMTLEVALPRRGSGFVRDGADLTPTSPYGSGLPSGRTARWCMTTRTTWTQDTPATGASASPSP
jgi:hypothetical protein